MNLTQLKEDISRLPAKERFALASFILNDLDSGTQDDETAMLWYKEADRRAQACASGDAEMVSREEVFARAYREFT